jgi:hypothetical protein
MPFYSAIIHLPRLRSSEEVSETSPARLRLLFKAAETTGQHIMIRSVTKEYSILNAGLNCSRKVSKQPILQLRLHARRS